MIKVLFDVMMLGMLMFYYHVSLLEMQQFVLE